MMNSFKDFLYKTFLWIASFFAPPVLALPEDTTKLENESLKKQLESMKEEVSSFVDKVEFITKEKELLDLELKDLKSKRVNHELIVGKNVTEKAKLEGRYNQLLKEHEQLKNNVLDKRFAIDQLKSLSGDLFKMRKASNDEEQRARFERYIQVLQKLHEEIKS